MCFAWQVFNQVDSCVLLLNYWEVINKSMRLMFYLPNQKLWTKVMWSFSNLRHLHFNYKVFFLCNMIVTNLQCRNTVNFSFPRFDLSSSAHNCHKRRCHLRTFQVKSRSMFNMLCLKLLIMYHAKVWLYGSGKVFKGQI